jgi:hypothetical protein
MGRHCWCYAFLSGFVVLGAGQAIAFPAATATKQIEARLDHPIVVATKCKADSQRDRFPSPCCGDHPPSYCK